MMGQFLKFCFVVFIVGGFIISFYMTLKVMNDEALLEKQQQTEITDGLENIQYIMILEGRWPAGVEIPKKLQERIKNGTR